MSSGSSILIQLIIEKKKIFLLVGNRKHVGKQEKSLTIHTLIKQYISQLLHIKYICK